MDENDRNAPATKGDFAHLRAGFKGDVAGVLEAFRDMETKLLTAFYFYTKSNDRRVLEKRGE